MNEKNRIHIPLKKVVKCAGDKAQEKKNTSNHYKNKQNSKLLTFSLPTKENCTGTQHDGPVANIFALSYKKCHC